MNYKKRDDELIRKQKEAQAKYRESITVKQNAANKNVYSKQALEKLASGGYKNRVPELKKTVSQNSVSKNSVSQNNVPAVSQQNKPSTRYQNQNVAKSVEQPRQTKRDTTYDRDFDTFHTYRYEKADMMDYDERTGDSNPHWQTLKKQIMSKNKWTEAQFDEKWEAYNKERNQRDADREVKNAMELGKEHPLLASFLQLGYTPQTIIEGGASMLSNLGKTEEKAQSADSPMFTGMRAQTGLTQAVKDNHINPKAQWLYNIATELPTMAFGPAAYAARAAERTNMNALDRGVDPDKAAATGALAGAVSYATNKLGEKVTGKVLGQGKTALGQVLRKAGGEGGENFAEDASNLGVDYLLNRDKSQLSALHDYYTSQGMTDEQARARVAIDTLGDLATSFGTGALWGGIMGGANRVPELVGDVRALIPEMNNRGAVDPKAMAEEARLNVKAPAKVEMPKKYQGLISEEDYNYIFDERNNGIFNTINLVRQHAGNTPEAQQLAKDAKKSLRKYVESGNVDNYYEFLGYVGDLSNMAENTRADYVTKGGRRYAYDDFFSEMVDDDVKGGKRQGNYFDYIDNGKIPEIVNNIRRADNGEVDPNNVVYHAGTLSRLNKADSAGKMEGTRDTGYYGTGHYFVDGAHKNEIGKGTSYGNKPYSSVDISKYDNLFKADNDAKANKLHNFSQKMMRFINGYNDKYYTDSEGIVSGELQEYMNDMYSDYKSLFGNRAMSQADFEDKLNDYRNNYAFDAEDRGDSAFTTFMKEHGYNGVDTRGTKSADTERGVVIYDLDEDSVLQSNVTDEDVKSGLMNTRVRNDNPVFDTATDEKIQKSLDSYSKKQQIRQEYERIFDTKELEKFESDIKDLKDEIQNIEENVIPYEEMMLEGGEGFEKEVDRTYREFKRFDPDVTREDIVELLRNNELERSNNIQNSRFKLNNLKQRLKEYQGIYDNLFKKSEAAYKQARENVEGTGDRALTPDEVQKLEEVIAEGEAQAREGLPPEYDLATRYTQLYRDFDTYDYDDTTFQGDDGIEKMADDIAKGRNLTGYIDALEEVIDDAPDAGTRAEMQSLIDELTALNEGRAVTDEANIPQTNNDIPVENNNIPPEPPRRSFFDEPPRSDKEGKSKVGTNTAVNAEIYTKDQIDNDPVISELNKYAKANNDLTFNQAKEDIIREGGTLLDDYTSGRREITNDLDVDRAMILLTDMAHKINAGDTDLEAQRNLLFSKLRQAGTLYGQTIQAFKKWNNTPEGAIINGERIIEDTVKPWKSRNKKKVELNGRIAKALEQMGVDSSMRNKPAAEKTHEQVKQGVKNVLAREYGSIEGYFNDNDIEFLTVLAENKQIPVWQITDEIEHKLATGEWYTLDESTQPKYPINQRLKNALDDLIDKGTAPEKEPPTLDEIRNSVRATLDKEMAGAGDFSDDDVNYLASLIENGATKQELTEALNTKMATGKFGISPETQQNVTDLFAYADKFDPNSKKAFDYKTAAYKLLAEEVVSDDASPFEKYESWRYLAMLGNPKTMIRNYVGNKMFGALTGVSNNLSAALEAGLDRLTNGGIQRTKAILNPVDDRDLIKAAANDGDAHRYKEISGTKYEKGTKDAIKKQKSVFNNKLLRLYEAATDRGISDEGAVRKKYSTSLAGYMKANGLDESAFDADAKYRDLKDKSRTQVLTDAERAEMDRLKDTYDALEKARDYAVKQAEYATFHEDNAFSKWLSQVSNNAPGPLRAVIEGLVPFKKTPANILRSGAEYSPLGAIKSIAETGKLIYENTGSRKGNLDDTYTTKSKLTGKEKEVNKSLAADVIDSWSKTLTGSALVGLGFYLKNKGILNSSNKDEKWQDDLEGKQNYSITINGHTYTLDWAAPAVMPLLMGAEISKIKDRNGLLDQKWYENMDEVVGTVNALLDPIFETSMLQGIKNTLESAANDIRYNEDGAIGGLLGSMAFNTGLGYATQGIPTLSGQIARTVDNTRRSTDTYTSQSFLGSVEKQGRKLMNKIPGLSFLNNPYYDSYGRTQGNSPWNDPIRGLLYQTLSPGYLREINTTAADESARNAYYSQNEEGVPIMDKNVFPSWKSQVKAGGQKLTPDEMASYRKTSGEAQYAIRDALAKEDWFNELSGEDQTELLKKVNTLVDKIGKDSVDKLDSSNKDFETYQSGGVPSLLNKWRGDKAGEKIQEETGLSTGTNAYKEIKQLYSEGKVDEAKQKSEQYGESQKKLTALNEQYGYDMKLSDYLKKEATYEGGAEQWLKDRQAAEEAGLITKSGQVQTAEYGKIMDRAGNQAAKMERDLPVLHAAGYGKAEMYTYANAINVMPSLQPQEFVKTYNAMNTNTKNKLTQEEIKDYLNSHYANDPQQAMRIWDTYADWYNDDGVKKKLKQGKNGYVDYY